MCGEKSATQYTWNDIDLMCKRVVNHTAYKLIESPAVWLRSVSTAACSASAQLCMRATHLSVVLDVCMTQNLKENIPGDFAQMISPVQICSRCMIIHIISRRCRDMQIMLAVTLLRPAAAAFVAK